MSQDTSSNSASHSTSPPRRIGRLVLRVLVVILGLTAAIAVIGAGLARWHVGRSVPQLDGEVAISGLAADVTVERDDLGVPTIRGQSRLDVARGLGFVHGQERFFQMDLIRRQAAGELAELVGAAALGIDRRARLHRFRARAKDVVEALDRDDRRLVDAYVEGVNAGLEALDAPPFEYAVLRTKPVPWLAEDCMLAVYTMYIDLQGGDANRERDYGVARDILPPALYAFLTPRGTEWDAPIEGEAFASLPIPSAEELESSGVEAPSDPEAMEVETAEPKAAQLESNPSSWFAHDGIFDPAADQIAVGSNNWAVAGSHSAHGGALLADDMHLGHDVPNIWYRASLIYPDPDGSGRERRITGVTLPGQMLVVAGSNGEVAWGFTNSYGDFTDLVTLEVDPEDPEVYLTPDGPQRFERHQEILRAGGEDAETVEVIETIWGPVWDTDHQGRQRALRWVAHDRRGVNLAVHELETVSDVDQAIEIANRTGIPAQNFVVADHTGRIGWTIMGPIPRRFGHDGRLPSSWADGQRGWDGWLEPAEVPRVVDPESGRIWTANSRVVSGESYALVGDGGYDLGARAAQIRDGLFELERATEADMLAIQLDDRALFLERWQRLLLEVLTPEAIAEDTRRAELRQHVEQWNGQASIDSVSYRVVRGFRNVLRRQVFEHLTAPCREAEDRFRYFRLGQYEAPLWSLITEQPPHLLNPEYATWQEQLLAAADDLLDGMLANGSSLASKTWGSRNQVRIRHPLSRFIPYSERWLDMPTTPLPGDSNMPRVQSVRNGASQRLVVSPGRESEGIFHMPTGQSGHPLSPHYGKGHDAWMEGRPTSFLPEATVHTLKLSPAS
ncbi:MAG: penicillin acylase family protein [Acidobacteriota bacterium]